MKSIQLIRWSNRWPDRRSNSWSESRKPTDAFILILNFKIGFMLFLMLLFSMRFLTAATPAWFRDTASRREIEEEIKKVGHNPLILNECNSFGRTGLMRAVGNVDLELVKAFLNAGADVNMPAQDNVGDTALHMACYNGSFGGMIPIIEYLIHFKTPGAAHDTYINRPEVYDTHINKYDMHINRNASIQRDIYKNTHNLFAADIGVRNKRGETLLHHAAQINILPLRKEVMQWLVERGANVNDQDREGTTILHIAVNNNDIYGVRMLFDTFGDSLNPYIVNFGKASSIPEQKKEEPPMAPLEYARYLGFRDVARELEEHIVRQQKEKNKAERFKKV